MNHTLLQLEIPFIIFASQRNPKLHNCRAAKWNKWELSTSHYDNSECKVNTYVFCHIVLASHMPTICVTAT